MLQDKLNKVQKVKYQKGEKRNLVALAVALDGDGIELGLGDDGDLGVQVDAEIQKLAC